MQLPPEKQKNAKSDFLQKLYYANDAKQWKCSDYAKNAHYSKKTCISPPAFSLVGVRGSGHGKCLLPALLLSFAAWEHPHLRWLLEGGQGPAALYDGAGDDRPPGGPHPEHWRGGPGGRHPPGQPCHPVCKGQPTSFAEGVGAVGIVCSMPSNAFGEEGRKITIQHVKNSTEHHKTLGQPEWEIQAMSARRTFSGWAV